ncbi:MAG: FtsX-like permease family protein [Caldilineaceae bacterium]
MKPILRLAWRGALRRPLQSLFFILGVAIGVAMIVAIDLANGSAQRAFALGTETVTGRATHQILGGPNGLDETVYTRLRSELGYRLSAPVVESWVIASELDAQPMRLLGIDPFSENPFRSYIGVGDQSNAPAPDYLTPLMTQPNTVLLSSALATRYGLSTGQSLTIRNGSKTQTLTIVGLLQPSDELSRRALDSLLITDIATAQEVLDKVGKLDRIDLIVGDKQNGEIERLRDWLPKSARLVESSARSGTVNEMTAAFQLNLTALSLLALVVGLFLIYNTVTFGVIQRRPVLGSLRALGMTSREIFALILLEAGVLGLIGTALGLVLGVVLGRGAVQLVTQTINDLFFVVSVREIEIPAFTLFKGALIGIVAALVGAAIPAWEATSVPPAGALKRSSVEDRAQALLPWISVGAVVLLLIGGLLLIPDWNLLFAFGGLFGVILGCALLTPAITYGLMQLVQRLARSSGVIARMAPRSINRSLSRTSVAVAALMVAVSVIIGVGVMIGSFRLTVVRWLEDVLQADIYISPANMLNSQASLTPDWVERLTSLPGIVRSATTRNVEVAAWVEDKENPQSELSLQLVALSNDLAGDRRRYRSAIGDNATTWQALQAGDILINEPMANRYKVGVGDSVTLQTDQGPYAFRVVGVTVDFDVNPTAFMYDPIYRQWWNDQEITAVALFVAPDVDVDEKAQEIRQITAGQIDLLVRSNRGMRTEALVVFDRTFAITVALQLLATLVAFIGILSTLMSLQLERTREIGVLRSTGMTRRQLWRLSLYETGLIGSVAGLIAMPVGLLLAIILIYIINLRSFGWTLELSMQPGQFAQAFLVAIGAALLAGIYPAWKMGQTQPAVAVRSE